MSEQGVGGHSGVSAKDANIAQELMEEDLQKEIARNQAATKMAMERELEALAARKRAEESQITMKAMLEKYELMKGKLDHTKKHLDETNVKISVQEGLTEKIQKMKERVEAYSNKKEAVAALNDAVRIKQDINGTKLSVVMEEMSENVEGGEKEEVRYSKMKADIADHAERVDTLKARMIANQEAAKKREAIKEVLEKQVALGEKRAEEQNKITAAREKLLELKLKELTLQKAKLERKRREQEERERATNDFFDIIDKELEEMESEVAKPDTAAATTKKETGATPKHQKGSKGKGKKSKSSTPKVMSPEPTPPSTKLSELVTNVANKAEEKIKEDEPKVKSPGPEPNTAEERNKKGEKSKVKSPEPKVKSPEPAQVKKSEEKVKSPEPKEKTPVAEPKEEIAEEELEKVKVLPRFNAEGMLELPEEDTAAAEDKMSEEEVKETVAKIEGKCRSVRGDIADMAMSEQYLRTKQAMLLAKKKEQEAKISENIATLREQEVQKMKEKVKQMQELLSQRKQKLKITDDILKEKSEEKRQLDKKIEAKTRRENYVENEILERVMFEKEPPKKK